jgi:hypothetical protein
MPRLTRARHSGYNFNSVSGATRAPWGLTTRSRKPESHRLPEDPDRMRSARW